MQHTVTITLCYICEKLHLLKVSFRPFKIAGTEPERHKMNYSSTKGGDWNLTTFFGECSNTQWKTIRRVINEWTISKKNEQKNCKLNLSFLDVLGCKFFHIGELKNIFNLIRKAFKRALPLTQTHLILNQSISL